MELHAPARGRMRQPRETGEARTQESSSADYEPLREHRRPMDGKADTVVHGNTRINGIALRKGGLHAGGRYGRRQMRW